MKLTNPYEQEFEYIRQSIGEAATYEQLAEECAELAQAALKKARAIRGDNPTPVTPEEADGRVSEEYTDVTVCAELIGLGKNREQAERKICRWIGRIRDAGRERSGNG